MYITHNKTLAVSEPSATGKEYTHHCGGKTFTDFNHELIVYHKRKFKTVQWKDLGPKMSVIYQKEPQTETLQPHIDTLQWCLTWYQGFDEQLNQQYYFLHDVDESILQEISDDVQQLLGINNANKHGSQYRLTTAIQQITPEHNLQTAMSVLFFLSTLYGKWDTRTIQDESNLRSITIQLPVLSQNTYLLSWVREMHQHLQSLGYFNTHSVIENEDGYIIQYTITDEEILSILTTFDLAKTYIITKKISTAELKTKFLDHCKELGLDTSSVRNSYLKFLPKK